jgi:hypothetical protein
VVETAAAGAKGLLDRVHAVKNIHLVSLKGQPASEVILSESLALASRFRLIPCSAAMLLAA